MKTSYLFIVFVIVIWSCGVMSTPQISVVTESNRLEHQEQEQTRKLGIDQDGKLSKESEIIANRSFEFIDKLAFEMNDTRSAASNFKFIDSWKDLQMYAEESPPTWFSSQDPLFGVQDSASHGRHFIGLVVRENGY